MCIRKVVVLILIKEGKQGRREDEKQSF